MNKIYNFLLRKWRRMRLFLRIFIFNNPQGADRWFWENGDETYRVNYPLDSQSIVFDLGGYKGEWAEKIYEKYKSHIWVFEPVKGFYDEIKIKFNKNSKVKIFPFGLGDATYNSTITLNENGSSSYITKGNGQEDILIVGVNEFFQKEKIGFIDLMKINIEGAEYSLLESILDNGLQNYIRDIQIQFHPWIENSEERRTSIQATLSKTHHLTYNFPFVWENWRKIDS